MQEDYALKLSLAMLISEFLNNKDRETSEENDRSWDAKYILNGIDI